MLMLQITGGIVLGFLLLAFWRQALWLAGFALVLLCIAGFFMTHGAPWSGLTGGEFWDDVQTLLFVGVPIAVFVAILHLPSMTAQSRHSSAPRK
jgi:hypothetical protein